MSKKPLRSPVSTHGFKNFKKKFLMPFVYQGSGKKLNKNSGLNLGQRDPRCRKLACDIQVRSSLSISFDHYSTMLTSAFHETVVSESKQLSTKEMYGFREKMGGLCRRGKFQKKVIIFLILLFANPNSSETISMSRFTINVNSF